MLFRTPLSFGQTIALITAAGAHALLAFWALEPGTSLHMPKQQVIPVTLVAPTRIATAPAPAIAEPAPKYEEEQPITPPKKEGWITKAIPKPAQPRTEKQATRPAAAPKQRTLATHTQTAHLTSGQQHEKATAKHAAITKPVAAHYLNNPPPLYPEKARRRGQEGTVRLLVRVKADGRPKQIHITQTSGHRLLDHVARNTVRDWRFIPAYQGQQPIEANVEVPIQFKLER